MKNGKTAGIQRTINAEKIWFNLNRWFFTFVKNATKNIP